MKRIDPTERALDAYFELDTDQKATFHAVLKHAARLADLLGHSAGLPAPTPKRGRPAGSKNRKPTDADQVELVEKLFGNNAAGAEGL